MLRPLHRFSIKPHHPKASGRPFLLPKFKTLNPLISFTMASTNATSPHFPPHLSYGRVDSSNIGTWLDLTNHVFSVPPPDGGAPFLSNFYPNGLTPQITAWALSVHEKAVLDPANTYALVYSSSDDTQPIATARWTVIPASTEDERREAHAKAEAERKADADAERIPGIDYDVFDVWRPAQEGGQDRVMKGREHVYLKILAVRPEWQGKGVGKAVLKHLLAEAGGKGLPVYLESSDAGVPVYAKVGFRNEGHIDWDAKRIGRDKSFKHTAMIWEP